MLIIYDIANGVAHDSVETTQIETRAVKAPLPVDHTGFSIVD